MVEDAVNTLSGDVTDQEMSDVAASIDQVRDVILVILPRLHTSLVRKSCEGCAIDHPSQTQHSCLEPADDETRTAQLQQCLDRIDDAMIGMVFAAGRKPSPIVEVESVKAICHDYIIEQFICKTVCTPTSETLVEQFYTVMNVFLATIP